MGVAHGLPLGHTVCVLLRAMQHNSKGVFPFQITESSTGQWALGNRVIRAGDIIEVQLLGQWYMARVEYDRAQDEYRLRLYNAIIPLTGDIPARWLLMD